MPLDMSSGLSGMRQLISDSALVRTRLPSAFEMFGNEPLSLRWNSNSWVPSDEPAKTMDWQVTWRLPRPRYSPAKVEGTVVTA